MSEASLSYGNVIAADQARLAQVLPPVTLPPALTCEVTDSGSRERWAWIPGYEGLYQVSDLGRVVSLHGHHGVAVRELSPRAGKGGYLYLSLHKGKERRTAKVHRLVLMVFEGPCPDGAVVRHLNGIPADNRLMNLRYGSPAENRRDQMRHGTARGGGGLALGPRNANAKLTASAVREIRRRSAAGESFKALGHAFGISDRAASLVVRRKTWKHVA